MRPGLNDSREDRSARRGSRRAAASKPEYLFIRAPEPGVPWPVPATARPVGGSHARPISPGTGICLIPT